jgi:nucleoside-diphosphate-sugar epimerase
MKESHLMRVFLAGATGVIGIRLVPLLIEAGHEVAGMTRSADKAPALRALGAEPVVCDVFDPAAVRDAMVRFRPDAVLHQVTDLPDDASLLPEFRPANARIRREGTHNLLAAARAAGADRFLAQSIAWTPPGDDGALEEFEQAVLRAQGVVLRYGQFYGPGTFFEDGPPSPPRIHVDAAARRTVPALTMASTVLTIVEE